MSSLGTAVVTGASSGIGAVYAERFAARGHDLLLVARRADKLSEVARRLSAAYGVKVETMSADLARDKDLHAVEQRLQSLPLTVLVNNAGIGGIGPTADSTADDQEHLIRLNVLALARLSVTALAAFRQTGRGTLINIASIIAHSLAPHAASYGGSKAFVLNFTRSLEHEYRDTDIRVQAVLPGPVRSEFFTSQGMDDSVFPENTFLTAEQMVDAALAGFDGGEVVTYPSLLDAGLLDDYESKRSQLLKATMSGQVADRYTRPEA